jgi:alpha-beta hydrolase superfamily lysophospholipase
VSASFAAHASDWPVIPPHDATWGRWPTTDVPVLALHGGYDATMPAARVAGFAEWLVRPHQRLVIVPLAEHVTLNRGACPRSLYRQFLADPTAELDTSCLADLPDYDWDGESTFNRQIWGNEDRWGDARRGAAR